MLLPILFFVMFGAAGLFAVMRGQHNAELWLVAPPVILAAALALWKGWSGDATLGIVLSGMLVIFASAAAGSLAGLGMGRILRARRGVQ